MKINFLFTRAIIPVLCGTIFTYGQIAVNQDGSSPDASAMLDIKSSDKGILIPRMQSTDRDAIINPATGLTVYVIDENRFYYFDGTQWIWLENNVTSVKKIDDLEDGKSDNDGSDNGSSVFLGINSGLNDDSSDNRNVGIGFESMEMNTTGENNVALGYRSLNANTEGIANTAVGFEAISNNSTGNYNTAIGGKTLQLNTTGSENTAVGYSALMNNSTGKANAAVGIYALRNNTTGNYNTAMGREALASNETGSYETAVGYKALSANTNGSSNSALGYAALLRNTTGDDNTAVGNSALFGNISGSYNTAIGYSALAVNTEGDKNTAVGQNALRSNDTGNNNTALGYNAFSSGNNYSNSTAIGYNAQISASNQVRIGDDNVTSIGGYADWTNLSDGRFKFRIKENVPGMELVMKLRPVTYHLNMDALARWKQTPAELRNKKAEAAKTAEIQIGFIAQEVEQAAKELNFDFHAVDRPKNPKDTYGLRYAEFVPVLVKALQEHQQIINKQQAEIESLKKQIQSLRKQLQ